MKRVVNLHFCSREQKYKIHIAFLFATMQVFMLCTNIDFCYSNNMRAFHSTSAALKMSLHDMSFVRGELGV